METDSAPVCWLLLKVHPVPLSGPDLACSDWGTHTFFLVGNLKILLLLFNCKLATCPEETSGKLRPPPLKHWALSTAIVVVVVVFVVVVVVVVEISSSFSLTVSLPQDFNLCRDSIPLAVSQSHWFRTL